MLVTRMLTSDDQQIHATSPRRRQIKRLV